MILTIAVIAAITEEKRKTSAIAATTIAEI